MARFRQWVSATLVVTLTSQLTGCIMRVDVPMQPTPEAFATRHPGAVRVTRADGSRLDLYQPHLVGDTLRGLDREPPTVWNSGLLGSLVRAQPRQLSVPLAAVRAMEDRSADVGLSIAVNLAIGVAEVLLIASAFSNSYY